MSISKNNTKQVKTGVVESIDDPTCSGRVKVRVAGLHDNIATENLPWCNYAGSGMFSGSGGGQISIPRVGTKVRVRFAQDDVNAMEWYGTNSIDRKLSEEMNDTLIHRQCVMLSGQYLAGALINMGRSVDAIRLLGRCSVHDISKIQNISQRSFGNVY